MPSVAVTGGDTRRFLVRFAGLALAMTAALLTLSPARQGLLDLTARWVVSASGLAGLAAIARPGGAVTFASPRGTSFTYLLVEECAALALIALFTVAVLAMPGVAWRRRAAGILAGVAGLLGLNVLRLVSLAWVGVHRPGWFDMAHVWLWQLLGVAALVAGWLAWLRWATGRADPARTGARAAAWFCLVAAALAPALRLHPTGHGYADTVEAGLRGIERLLAALPYTTLPLTWSPDAWTVGFREVTFVVAVSLAAAVTGPARRARLANAALAVPLVFAAQVVGEVLGRAAAARLAQFALTPPGRAPVPLLLIVHGLPVLVPIMLGLRSRGAPGPAHP